MTESEILEKENNSLLGHIFCFTYDVTSQKYNDKIQSTQVTSLGNYNILYPF